MSSSELHLSSSGSDHESPQPPASPLPTPLM